MRAVVVLDLQESDFAPERPAGEARGVDLPPLVMLKMKMREWKLWRVDSFPCQLRQAWEQGLLESWEKEKKCARWVESTSQEVAWPRETARLQSKVSSKGKSHQRGWTRQQSRSAEKLGSSQLDLLWWKTREKEPSAAKTEEEYGEVNLPLERTGGNGWEGVKFRAFGAACFAPMNKEENERKKKEVKVQILISNWSRFRSTSKEAS